jgi:Zn-dependent protease
MLPTRDGSIRLFRLLGIDVHLHWSWFVVALWLISRRAGEYSSPLWTVAEYLAIFGIVLLHEYGHALACRQVGGRAEQIVLWPLGGVAYVAPPQRAGAQLWSIAAGPLVNVALVPVLYGALWLVGRGDFADAYPDFADWLVAVNFINALLLVFNLLPIYPLDGGQILRSVLWFMVGPVKSLLVATCLGFLGGGALLVLGLVSGWWFMAIVAAFLLFNCWQSFRFARAWRAHLEEEARSATGGA